uniref:Trafficking protein particle complex subunit 1 n=1 Tax=Tanacetum cinerariifolium TaxID=118510 RepID=A0A6L2JNK5_TANCI|nr:trafficking protein particle complex subunit 1 [Tanacetum cinerariifolium]
MLPHLCVFFKRGSPTSGGGCGKCNWCSVARISWGGGLPMTLRSKWLYFPWDGESPGGGGKVPHMAHDALATEGIASTVLGMLSEKRFDNSGHLWELIKDEICISSGTLGMALDSLTHLSLKFGRVSFAIRTIFEISVGSLAQALSIPNLFKFFLWRSPQLSMLLKATCRTMPLPCHPTFVGTFYTKLAWAILPGFPFRSSFRVDTCPSMILWAVVLLGFEVPSFTFIDEKNNPSVELRSSASLSRRQHTLASPRVLSHNQAPNFPFRLRGIFLSRRTYVAALHFNQADLIQWDTSSSILPDLWIIDPRYLKDSLVVRSCHKYKYSLLLCGRSQCPRSHLRYSVFSRLTPKPLSSKASFQFSSMLFEPFVDPETSTISEWNRPLRTLDSNQDHKLMFGLLFSLKSLTAKMDPSSAEKGNLGVPQLPGQGCSFHSFRTNTYKLSFMESPSGIKIILVTHPKASDLRESLKYIYNLYVEYVVKNPLYTPGTPIKSDLFNTTLDQYVRGLG